MNEGILLKVLVEAPTRSLGKEESFSCQGDAMEGSEGPQQQQKNNILGKSNGKMCYYNTKKNYKNM